MKISFVFWSCISIVSVMISHFTSAISIWRQCEFATAEKYLGYFDTMEGKLDNVKPLNSSYEISNNLCKEKCRKHPHCYSTEYALQSGACLFYKVNYSAPHSALTGFKYSPWRPCDQSKSQSTDGRCVGFWVMYHDRFIQTGFNQNLRNVSSKLTDCAEHCQNNPFCGYANYVNKTCMLVTKWAFTNCTELKMNGSKLLKWTCTRNFVNNLQIPKLLEKPNDQKCTGYWKISSRTATFRVSRQISFYFYSQAYKNCLAECHRYRNCFTAWYNATRSLCVLDGFEISNKSLIPQKDLIFIKFDWICVKNDAVESEMNADEKRFVRLGMDCYRIVNNSNLFIGMDVRGQFPHSSKFVQCTEQYGSLQWSIANSCYLNQSYWSFPSQSIPRNISGQTYTNLTKVFTGLQVYWLAYSDHGTLLKVPFLECRSFNASRPTERLSPETFVSKQEWHAQNPIGNLSRFSSMPSQIVVSSTEYPFHSCRTKAACSEILLRLQQMHFNGLDYTPQYDEIPYNFIIDDDGNIYEGRGWNHQCAAVAVQNPYTICIGYIGYFKYRLPTERFITSTKKLIEFAVENGHLQRKYKLFIHQDLAKYKVQRYLAIAIKNWYRYRGFLPEDNSYILYLVIPFNIVSVIVVVVCCCYFYNILAPRHRCDKCKLLPCRDLHLHQLYPIDGGLQRQDHPTNEVRDFHVKYVIYERGCLVSKHSHLRTVKSVKVWLLNNLLATMNSQCLGNDLSNYLQSCKLLEEEMTIYHSVCLTATANILLVVCLSNKNSIHLFKRLIRDNGCICQFFCMDPMDLLSAAKNLENIRAITPL